MQLPMTTIRRRSGAVRLILNLALLAFVFGNPGRARAQTYTAFSVFDQMTTTELATCQLKLTRNVMAGSPPPTYLFATSTLGASLNPFYSFERPGFSYISDYVAATGAQPGAFESPKVIVLTASKLETVISAVAPLSGVVDGGFDPSAELSFALLQTNGGTTQCFESLLDAANTTLLLSALKQALLDDAPAYDAVAELACDEGWLNATNATLIPSSDIQITMSGLRRNRSAGDWRFNGTVTVKNISNATLTSPLFLVLGCKDPLVTLVGASGRTCRIKPSGAPYLILPVGAGLPKNASVTLPLAFDNPLVNKIDLNFVAANNQAIYPRVFQGTGER